MAIPYTKPYLSLPDQLALLKGRGLQVTDDAKAEECLHRNGYYRLSAYWYPFREIVAGKRTDNFLKDSRFDDALSLYIFDKDLKLILLDAIERVEIAVRVDIAMLLGARNPFAYIDPALLHKKFTTMPNREGKIGHQEWLRKFNVAVERSRDTFVKHHINKYGAGSPLPIWIAIELWDFGQLSFFFSGMTVQDRQAVASRFSVPDWGLMASWLRSLNYVRNIIAHHGRLWNLNLVDGPKLPRRGVISDFDVLLPPNVSTRIYSVCCILCHFSRVVNPQSDWPYKLARHVRSFPSMPHANIQDMGFPSNWQNHSFWK